MDECAPLPMAPYLRRSCMEEWKKARPYTILRQFASFVQGLTLVQFSAQRKRFLWYRGCVEGLLRGNIAGVRGI